jgi:hypothetical protein
MDWSALALNVFRLALLLAGLLVPGSMLLRALRLPWSLAAAFLSSAATLYLVVLVCACTGFTISLLSLTAALCLVALGGHLAARGRRAAQMSSAWACFSQMGPWLPLYLAFWAVVGYRLLAQPLSGPDVNFRWSYLAEQMLQFGSLDFYPARSAADFLRYFWTESIPPGIASLYAWAYACGGSNAALWTSPVVGLQLLSLHEIIWRLGSRWGGEVVARRAVLLAAACPLLTWSVLIGQETGLSALAVGGLVWSLPHLRESDGRRWAVLAGLFAVAAASTREYGPIFAVAAVVAAGLMPLPRRTTLTLAMVALLALIWPLRVWLLTGNPFYSLSLGPLFSVNPVFHAWLVSFRAPHASIDGLALARYFLLWALPAVLGLIALLILLQQRLREARLLTAFVGLSLALWLMSVAYTAGGLFYSLRVLSPALALLVVAASYGIQAALRHSSAARYTAFGLVLLLVESLPKTLVLPENPYKLAPSAWLQAINQFPRSAQAEQQAIVAKLKALPGHRRILTDNAGLPRLLAELGIDAVPLWSPEVAWLFDPNITPKLVARRWQRSGMRYLVIGKSSPTAEFIHSHARWRAPYIVLNPVAESADLVILEVTLAILPGQ